MADWRPPLSAIERLSPALAAAHDKLVDKRRVPSVNLPALARRDAPFMSTWVADEGRTFVSCDFSSLEPSISAHFSQDPYYSYATFGGIGRLPYIDHAGVLMIDDVYLMTASVMPGIGETIRAFFQDVENCRQWLKDKESITGHKLIKPLRSKAKPACLGFNYGMGPKRFVNQSYEAGSNVTLSEAKAMYKAYWELFAGVGKLAKKLEALLKKNGSIVNPFGYRLTPESHKGYNAFIQSSASGVVDVLALDFFTSCPEARFIAFIHDEIIFDIDDALLDYSLKVKNECVDRLNKTLGWSVPMRLGFCPAKTFAGFK